MNYADCRKCGARIIDEDGVLRFENVDRCADLKGTKYLDSQNVQDFGIRYCPSLSDSAAQNWSLLPSGSRRARLPW